MIPQEGSNRTIDKEPDPIKLAVFDFDGTSISGNSPVILVRYLWKKRMLKKRNLLKIISWGLAYKFRLPQNEAWVRGLVFTAFDGKPKAEVDQFLRDFYDEAIDGRFRKEADVAMQEHADAGHDVVVISATFEPIVERAMEKHPFQHQVSTRMRIDAGENYTCEVEGEPMEGEAKLRAIQHYADEKYGAEKWKLGYAYSDHHSDRPLLHAAERAFAIDPDNPLERTAKREGWEILDWD